MACLNTLPTEILQKIAKSIPRRPFKTDLLLISKTLCSILMIEQVRSLTLSINQVDRWITLITNNDVKKSCSVLQYRNILDHVYELFINLHEKLSTKAIAGFISRCINLRKFSFEVTYTDMSQLEIDSFFDGLPSKIVEIHLHKISTVNNERIQSLSKYLKRSIKLSILHLFDCNVDDCGAYSLSEYLRQNSTLTQLNLRYNNIGDEGACALAECLKQNSTLTHLNLWINRIAHKGASALAESLKQNSTLIQLDLCHNSINEAGAYALAESLKWNTSLMHLDIGGNNIGDKGADALAESLKQNSSLTELNLARNHVSTNGACAIGQSLKHNSTLIILNLCNNGIGDEGACALAEGLKLNSSLRQLNFQHNKISNKIGTLLKHNTIFVLDGYW